MCFIGKLIDMTGWIMSEHGVPDSRLTVIKYLGNSDWLVKCNCGSSKEWSVNGQAIREGKSKSCGCLCNEVTIKNNKKKHKTNTYNLSGEYGIGFTSNTNVEFYFDLEDYDKIKDYCWNEHILQNGYHALETYDYVSKKRIRMHWIIVGKYHDHKDRNPLNNRKQNLRPATQQENSCNITKRKDNTSGVTGVYWYKKGCKWVADISVNNKRIHLGYFTNKEDAIKKRLEAEQIYHKEFSSQEHLLNKYFDKFTEANENNGKN